MRTNVVLDVDLVRQAMRLTGAKTKRDVIQRALESLVAAAKAEVAHERRHRTACRGLLKLRGIGWDGDLSEARRERDFSLDPAQTERA